VEARGKNKTNNKGHKSKWRTTEEIKGEKCKEEVGKKE
jgi:hypothetical protein